MRVSRRSLRLFGGKEVSRLKTQRGKKKEISRKDAKGRKKAESKGKISRKDARGAKVRNGREEQDGRAELFEADGDAVHGVGG